jgi:tetratricopeptide (TPR) repeat protein
VTVRTEPAVRSERETLEPELLARLGLAADASSQEVEAAHDEFVAYLEKAPYDLRAWARRQIAAADEAYALLSDPTIDRSAPAAAAPAIAVAKPAPVPGAPRAAAPDDDESVEELDDVAPTTRRARRETGRTARSTAGRDDGPQPVGAGLTRIARRIGVGAAAIVGVAAIAVAGYNLNGGPGLPAVSGTPAPETSVASGIDLARVAELMAKVEADPIDVASLQELGDTYYLDGDYETAGAWMEKILTVDPNNLQARLALGAALFNLGNPAEAEQQWRQVLALDPNNVDAHYSLGFLYLNQSPPDMAKVRVEWGRVVEIAPDSEIAKTIAVHLDSFDASPTPSGSQPLSGTSPGATPTEPAASPAASGN